MAARNRASWIRSACGDGSVWLAVARAAKPYSVAVIGGDKAGENHGRFCNRLIRETDAILDHHLALLKKAKPWRILPPF
jgi:hypothetical protein